MVENVVLNNCSIIPNKGFMHLLSKVQKAIPLLEQKIFFFNPQPKRCLFTLERNEERERETSMYED